MGRWVRLHTSNKTSIGIDMRPSSAPVFPLPFVRFLGWVTVVPPGAPVVTDAVWSIFAFFLGLVVLDFADTSGFAILDEPNSVSIVPRVVECERDEGRKQDGLGSRSRWRVKYAPNLHSDNSRIGLHLYHYLLP